VACDGDLLAGWMLVLLLLAAFLFELWAGWAWQDDLVTDLDMMSWLKGRRLA
jgi:hypothetical protein